MDQWPAWARRDGNLLMLDIHVQPGARVSEIVGEHGARLKIKISAPAADNAANEALLDLIAKLAAVPKSRVKLVRGQSSRMKCLAVDRPSPAFVHWITGARDAPFP